MASNDLTGIGKPFRPALDRMGTNVPEIATVAGILIGTLQFDAYFNAAAWTVVAVVCFGIVYVYRRQIPLSLPKATAVAIGWMLVGSVLIVLYASHLGGFQQLLDWSAEHPAWASFVTGAVVSGTVGIIAIGYRQQEEVWGRSFPATIHNAIRSQVYARHFVKKNLAFLVTLESHRQDRVAVTIRMAYEVTNLTEQADTWYLGFRKNDPAAEILEATIGDRAVDLTDPKSHSTWGLNAPHLVQPGQTIQCDIRVRQWFSQRDSEMFTSYFPCTDLTLTLVNETGTLLSNVEKLHFDEVATMSDGKLRTVVINTAILPFQGVRVNWYPKEEEHARVKELPSD